MNTKHAFTIIELIIVFALILIFTGISFAYYNNATEQRQLDQDGNQFIDVLELAKRKAIAGDRTIDCSTPGDQFMGYRVTLTASVSDVYVSNYRLEIECATSSTRIKLYQMQTQNIISGKGESYIQFSPVTGTVTSNISNGTISLIVKNTHTNECITVTVTNLGLISEGARTACLSTS